MCVDVEVINSSNTPYSNTDSCTDALIRRHRKLAGLPQVYFEIFRRLVRTTNDATPHALRTLCHNYATHPIESGANLYTIQRLFGDWMYIRTYDDGYHLFPKEMLFNLKDDPYEQRDVAE